MGVSVSKRLFKHAVDRNRHKRLIREAYRLQKPTLYESLDKSYAIMIIYISKKPLRFEDSQKTMKKILDKFIKQIHEKI